eukprot:9287630-Pyramimonas_sp.AAC.1
MRQPKRNCGKNCVFRRTFSATHRIGQPCFKGSSKRFQKVPICSTRSSNLFSPSRPPRCSPNTQCTTRVWMASARRLYSVVYARGLCTV